MNLLGLLLSAFLSNQALGTLSNNTGVQKPQLQKLLILALPLIIKYMTSNASSQSGLSSLFGALGAHQNRDNVSAQFEEADTEDGLKILGHILGNDQEQVVDSLAKESGVDIADVVNVLGTIAPSILNGVSAATESAHQQQQAVESGGFDLGDLISLFGGVQQEAPKPQATAASDGTQLINALLSMMQ